MKVMPLNDEVIKSIMLFGTVVMLHLRLKLGENISDDEKKRGKSSNFSYQNQYYGRMSFEDLLEVDGPSNRKFYRPSQRNYHHFESFPLKDYCDLPISLPSESDTHDSFDDFPSSDFTLPNTNINTPTETSPTETTDHTSKKNISISKVNFNRCIMPKNVILVRHGQSEGNVSEILYTTKPDNLMRITKKGWDDARMAGRTLRERILTPGEKVYFIVSPYVRTIETFHGILSAYCDLEEDEELKNIKDVEEKKDRWYSKLHKMGLSWHEDPRIREQDFGNYQKSEHMKKYKAERHKFGAFYYRFPYGESTSDVYDRVSTFLDSLWRAFESQHYQNYVLVTHGLSIRALLARYFRYTIDQFHMMANPGNCELIVLKHDGRGKLRLNGRYSLEEREEETDSTKDGTEKETEKGKSCIVMRRHVFYPQLRTLPPHLITKRDIHLYYSDR